MGASDDTAPAGLASPVVEASTSVVADDWRAAVRAACQPLAAAGAVDARYAERCIAIAEEHGPYMVLAPGLALAHARPEDGVNRLCLASTTLAAPVRFGHDDNDPVDVVLAFGSPDDSSHLRLLQALAEHLMTGLAETLRAAPDREHAVDALRDVVREM